MVSVVRKICYDNELSRSQEDIIPTIDCWSETRNLTVTGGLKIKAMAHTELDCVSHCFMK